MLLTSVKKMESFVLNVNDRWAHEYNGEQVRIKVELYKDGFLFFDSFKGKKEVTLNSASNYEIIFAENELTKNNEILAEAMKDFNPEFNKGSKKYFVKWGFQRVGLISTNDYVNKGKTDKI